MIQPSDIAVKRNDDDVFVHLSVSVNRSVEKFQIGEDPDALKQAEAELRGMLWNVIYGDIESDLQALYDRIGRERIARADVLAGIESVIKKLSNPIQ